MPPLNAPAGDRSCPDFHQSVWDDRLAAHVARMAREWFAEDLGHECDWTSVAIVAAAASSELRVVARRPGTIAGLSAAGVVAAAAASALLFVPLVAEGASVAAGDTVATLAGPTRGILGAERVILNLVGRLSGIATATRRLVDAVAGTRCRVYDTRKTVPGWRLLDKYAVRAGGGWNHRMGLYDAILIKDNHLAAAAAAGLEPAAAVRRAREFVRTSFPPDRAAAMVVEIEIDSVVQLSAVLDAGPDVVLLDNMGIEELARCVAVRDARAPRVVLEASGGIRPETVAAIATTGVDRVSSGWPTHDAPWLDIALDWG
ncbi:MAG: carboxylating nicotinate-nucleotide diphosphorylase [Planctomycetia bacterium]